MSRNRSHQVYKLPDGRVVPSVTTVLNILEKPGIHYWIAEETAKGNDWRKAQSQAMDIGTLTHAMIQAYLQTGNADSFEGYNDYSKTQIDVATTAFLAFLEWEKGQNLTTIATEVQMVHDDLEYGGTADWVAKTPEGQLWLIDFKTSKDGACYPEYRYQVAAYAELWDRINIVEARFPLISRCIILSLNKETGLPTPHIIEDTERYFKIFDLCRQIYKLQKEKV